MSLAYQTVFQFYHHLNGKGREAAFSFSARLAVCGGSEDDPDRRGLLGPGSGMVDICLEYLVEVLSVECSVVRVVGDFAVGCWS